MGSPIKSRLFTFLSASYRAVGDALRTNPRHGSSARARLSWPGKGEDVTVRARLIDISRAGAALVAREVPPVDAPVRLRLVGHESTPWVEAKVLGADPMSRGRHRIRLLFREPCPTFFLRAAVLGPPEPEAESPAPGQAEAKVDGQWDEVPSGETTRGAFSQ
jgi:hypothetical protein